MIRTRTIDGGLSLLQYAIAVAVTLSIASALGVLLEKQRSKWSQLLAWIFARVARRVGSPRRA